MRIALIATMTALTLGWTLAPPVGPALLTGDDAPTTAQACCAEGRAPGQHHARHDQRQSGHRGHHCTDGECAMPPYAADTEEVLDVEVLEVQRMEHRGSSRVGIHLRVRIDGREATVHLGPESFLSERGLTPEAGMALQVTGSWVDHMGERIVLARSVTHEDRAFELRDSDGRPLWAPCPGCR